MGRVCGGEHQTDLSILALTKRVLDLAGQTGWNMVYKGTVGRGEQCGSWLGLGDLAMGKQEWSDWALTLYVGHGLDPAKIQYLTIHLNFKTTMKNKNKFKKWVLVILVLV